VKELIGALIFGVIGLAWGSLVFRRAQGVVAVEQQTGTTFATATQALFSA